MVDLVVTARRMVDPPYRPAARRTAVPPAAVPPEIRITFSRGTSIPGLLAGATEARLASTGGQAGTSGWVAGSQY